MVERRNCGIDFLRIISMFFVVILHTIRHCNVETNAVSGSIEAYGTYFLKTAAYGAVNCFAIITGFVMSATKPRISKAMLLWAQTAFYTIACMVLFAVVFKRTIGYRDVLNAVLPVSRKQYWFITAYMGMYLLVPFLNTAIHNMEKKACIGLLGICFFAFSVVPTALDSELFGLAGGYTTLWLCFLYLIGGCIRQFNLMEKMRAGTMFLCYGVCVCITFASKYILDWIGLVLLNKQLPATMLCQYISPTVLLSAVFLVGGFAKLSITGWLKKAVVFFAPAALGVYLIQSNPYVWERLWPWVAPYILGQTSGMVLASILIVAAMIVLACLTIDRLRIYLFQLLRIPAVCQKIETKVTHLWNKD